MTSLVLALLAGEVRAAQPARQPSRGTADEPKGAGAGDLFKRPSATTVAPQTTKSTSRVSQEAPFKADSFEQLQVDESLKDKRPLVTRMLRDGFGAGEQQTFNDYYNNYAFPRWTVPANITSLPDFRKDLSTDLRPAGEGGATVRTQLLELALNFLTRFAKGKYHPATRYNAMLGIGELYAHVPGAARASQPLPAALPVMMEAVKSADQIDAVKIAALIGILRHASLGISDLQYRDQEVVPTMLTIATTKVSPGRNPEGHAWIRAQAIDVLGEIGSVGQQNAVVTALAEISASAETPWPTRCAAARALGKLRYDPNAEPKLNGQDLARQVARLAADALAYEADQKTPDFDSLLLSRQSGKKPGVAVPKSSFGSTTETKATPSSTVEALKGLSLGKDRDRNRERDRDRLPPEKEGAMTTGKTGVGARLTPVSPERARLEEEYALSVRRRLLDRVDAVKDALGGPRDPERIGIVGLAPAPAQKSYIAETLVPRLDAVVNLCEDDKLRYADLMKKIKEEAPLLRAAIDQVPSEKAEGGEQAPAAGDTNASPDAKATP